MNIWIFNHYATTPFYVGGTRHYDLAYELVKKGHQVTIFASSFNHFIKEETHGYDKGVYYIKEDIKGINYVWVKTAGYTGTVKRIKNILDYTYNAYRAAKEELKVQASGSPDIIIGSSVHPLAAYIGYLISKKTKKPFYFEERDLWPQTFVDFGKLGEHSLVAKALYSFERFLYKKAKKIIVLFEKATDYVASRGIVKDKVIYLPNGVNIENFQEIKQDEGLTEVMQSFKYKVVYTGSHGIANHLEPLIETANLLKKNSDVQFILVGNGLKKEDLIRQAKQYDLSNVTFLDSVPKEKIPYLLSMADLSFISIKKSPLYKWGFSMNKLYDYMASGLPVMLYSSKEVVGSFGDIEGINLSESPDELAEGILNKIYDEEYKLEAGNALKKYVENNYSWAKLAIKLESHMLDDVKQE